MEIFLSAPDSGRLHTAQIHPFHPSFASVINTNTMRRKGGWFRVRILFLWKHVQIFKGVGRHHSWEGLGTQAWSMKTIFAAVL